MANESNFFEPFEFFETATNDGNLPSDYFTLHNSLNILKKKP